MKTKTATSDAYLTFNEWLFKHYKKTPEELSEEEDEELYDRYQAITTEWIGISAVD